MGQRGWDVSGLGVLTGHYARSGGNLFFGGGGVQGLEVHVSVTAAGSESWLFPLYLGCRVLSFGLRKGFRGGVLRDLLSCFPGNQDQGPQQQENKPSLNPKPGLPFWALAPDCVSKKPADNSRTPLQSLKMVQSFSCVFVARFIGA